MQRRKLQLIAGTTYTVSLPKTWVVKNGLKEQSEVVIQEKNDQTLTVSTENAERKRISEISLNVETYAPIDQILFAAYYLGIETINLYSDNKLTKQVKADIRKTLTNMSGTEISYEDQKKITIRVLLDKSRVNISQILYRISLIIDSSIVNIVDDFDFEEIDINENEVDRLYHLMAKITSLSLIDGNVLQSSSIKNVTLIPSYFLMSKKLENVADNIYHIAKYIEDNKVGYDAVKKVFLLIKEELSRSISHVRKEFPSIFVKFTDFKKVDALLDDVADTKLHNYLSDVVRYIMDIESEIVNISFYTRLIQDEKL